MKQKLSKIIIVVTLVGILMAIPVFSVHATELDTPIGDEIIEEYQYTNSVSANLSIASKTATCRSTVVGKSGVTKIVLTQYMQKYVNGSWTNVSTWNKTVNTYVVSFTNTKSSLSSGTYRTRTVAKVYKNNNYETVSANSSNVTV